MATRQYGAVESAVNRDPGCLDPAAHMTVPYASGSLSPPYVMNRLLWKNASVTFTRASQWCKMIAAFAAACVHTGTPAHAGYVCSVLKKRLQLIPCFCSSKRSELHASPPLTEISKHCPQFLRHD